MVERKNTNEGRQTPPLHNGILVTRLAELVFSIPSEKPGDPETSSG